MSSPDCDLSGDLLAQKLPSCTDASYGPPRSMVNVERAQKRGLKLEVEMMTSEKMMPTRVTSM